MSRKYSVITITKNTTQEARLGLDVSGCEETTYAVSAGGDEYYISTVTSNKKQAQGTAKYLKAMNLLEQVEANISDMTLLQAQMVGQRCHAIATVLVQDRCREEDPNFSEMDPCGWLA